MKLDLKALSIALALFWAGVVLIVGIANLIWPTYGRTFLEMLASIYPGFKAAGTFGDMISGSLYALVDGALVGLVFGWLYNLFAGRKTATASES